MGKRYRQSEEERRQSQIESLSRAREGQSLTNYPAIFEGFMVKGIPGDEIRPRENVLTFNAWKALGRHVRKGEHGVKVVTVIKTSKENPETGEQELGSYISTATVFHISQTEPDTITSVRPAVEKLSVQLFA